jgi:hypothetical protein
METDLLDLYRRAGEWCGEKVAGATTLDASTPCDDWNVRDLLNHILDTQHGEPGVIEKTGPALGIAFSDQLLHGWDVARATGQDAEMPAGLAESAYGIIHGRFTEEQRHGVFKPEIPVPEDASAQERLLAYTGRSEAAAGGR